MGPGGNLAINISTRLGVNVFIIPVIDAIPYWIDTRVITTGFKAEKTLTKDTVPVDVDAVLFWKILDPKKAALDVADYRSAISWASQPPCAMSSAKRCFRTCLRGGTKSAHSCKRLLMNAPSLGALMLFQWSVKTF